MIIQGIDYTGLKIPDFILLSLEEESRQKKMEFHRTTQHNLELKRAKCTHIWNWICSCHNDDAYGCTICGETKYE
jgi:hypothetical protein